MRARYRDESSKKPAGTLLELVDVDMTGHFRTYPAQKGFKMGLNTWIIETDYRSYAVRFSCSAAEQGGSYQMAVILTRKRLPPHSTVAEAKRKAFRARIPMIPMKLVNQRNCWNL
ncbi:uncharacterized protein LOC115631924 [Scaptodrosophila lebanonensis]|uniref:Uncharacterized protein LOC115631924 n=1 Tax=Drosophila lebanonensis TaxID=7225 RepID=A0A6J2U9F7_DROLE|nr:uncharacterized protein LOC115631924 [Scaptodrosophila lebanonensis]